MMQERGRIKLKPDPEPEGLDRVCAEFALGRDRDRDRECDRLRDRKCDRLRDRDRDREGAVQRL